MSDDEAPLGHRVSDSLPFVEELGSCGGINCEVDEAGKVTHIAPCEKAKKRRKRAPKVQAPPDEGPRFCVDGCGVEVKRKKPTGRPPRFATRYCQTVFQNAVIAGWDQASGEMTARQYMALRRANAKEGIREEQPVEVAGVSSFINPVICTNPGCGCKARVCSAKCGREVEKAEREAAKASKGDAAPATEQ